MALPAVALALLNMAPALLKLFGQDAPAEITEKAIKVAQVVTGTDTPEKALSILEADPIKMLEYQTAVEERALTWYRLHIEDTQNARKRDIELSKAGFRNLRSNWLTIFAMILVVGLIILACRMNNVSEWVQGVILFALGRAWGYLDQVYNFEFGTTKQSKAKDDTIQALSKE